MQIDKTQANDMKENVMQVEQTVTLSLSSRSRFGCVVNVGSAQIDEEVFLICLSLISLHVFLTCCALSPLGHRTTGDCMSICSFPPCFQTYSTFVLKANL